MLKTGAKKRERGLKENLSSAASNAFKKVTRLITLSAIKQPSGKKGD